MPTRTPRPSPRRRLSLGGAPIRRAVVLALAAVAGGLGLAGQTGAATLPKGFVLQPVLQAPQDDLGRDQLTAAFAYAADGRLFVAEQYGVVKSFDGTRWTEFLDISDEVNSAGDRGLLGLAVSPTWLTDRLVCLMYTTELRPSDRDSLAAGSARIACVQGSAGDPGVADLATLRVLLEGRPTNSLGFRSDSSTHSVGALRFAPDGTLLASLGDGADYDGVDRAALRVQDLDSLNGKILRLDPATGAGVPGNPFYSPAAPSSNRSRVLAWGLRNPFRFSLDARAGRLFVSDVGWGTWEELNVVTLGGESGQNFGWPCFEGGLDGARRVPLPNPGYQEDRGTRRVCRALGAGKTRAPLAAIEHTGEFGNAFVAGPLYEGTSYPASFRGKVLVADYAAEDLYLVDPRSGRTSLVARSVGNIVDMQLLPNGNVGILTLPLVGEPGWLYELVHAGANLPPTAVAATSSATASRGQQIGFDATASNDPEGGPLEYRWDFGDGSAPASGVGVSHAFADEGSYRVRLVVSDGAGLRAFADVRVDVENTRPTLQIVAPAATFRYRVGQRIPIELTTSDVEDGGRPRGLVGWQLVLHHGGHLHPVNRQAFGETRAIEVPEHEDDSYLEIRAVAQDSGGGRIEASVAVHPLQVRVRIASPLRGTVLLVDGRPRRAPFTWLSTVGGEHEVSLLSSRPKRTVRGWRVGTRLRPGEVLRFTTPSRPLTIALEPA